MSEEVSNNQNNDENDDSMELIENPIISVMKTTAVRAKFQPFNRKGIHMFTLDSEECGKFITFHEKGDFIIPIRVPGNDDVPRFSIEQLRNKFTRLIHIVDRNVPRKNRRSLGRVLVLAGTILHAIDSFILNEHKGNFLQVTAQVIGIAQKHPNLPVSKNNEVRILIRDYFEHYPVMEVYVAIEEKLPFIRTGFMIRCLGVLKSVTVMKAFRITVLC